MSTVKNFQLPISNFQFSQKGFTLIELLIVVAIIAVLVSIGAVSFSAAQRQARDSQRKSDLESVAAALEQYYSDHTSYPEDDSTIGKIQCGSPVDVKDWGTEPFACNDGSGPVTYLSLLPTDPKGGQTYYYDSQDVSGNTCTGSDCQRFVISADLEGDPPATLPCTPETGYDYCVNNP